MHRKNLSNVFYNISAQMLRWNGSCNKVGSSWSVNFCPIVCVELCSLPCVVLSRSCMFYCEDLWENGQSFLLQMSMPAYSVPSLLNKIKSSIFSKCLYFLPSTLKSRKLILSFQWPNWHWHRINMHVDCLFIL